MKSPFVVLHNLSVHLHQYQTFFFAKQKLRSANIRTSLCGATSSPTPSFTSLAFTSHPARPRTRNRRRVLLVVPILSRNRTSPRCVRERETEHRANSQPIPAVCALSRRRRRTPSTPVRPPGSLMCLTTFPPHGRRSAPCPTARAYLLGRPSRSSFFCAALVCGQQSPAPKARYDVTPCDSGCFGWLSVFVCTLGLEDLHKILAILMHRCKS